MAGGTGDGIRMGSGGQSSRLNQKKVEKVERE